MCFRCCSSGRQDEAKALDWLNEYVNEYMLAKGLHESSRRVAFATVKEFYQRNDSPLFGDFQVSQDRVVPLPGLSRPKSGSPFGGMR